MLNRSLLFLTLLFAGTIITEQVKAQRMLGAVSVGMNLTQVDGDAFYGFKKFGLNVGPMIIIPFSKSKNWSVSMELLYSQKGSYHKGATDSTTSYTYSLVQDYAEIPVLVHYTDKKLISAGVGFSYGRLINYKETKNNFFDTLYTYKTPLSYNDFSVIADLQIRIWSKLWANVRYQYTMKSNREVVIDNPFYYPRKPFTRNQYNNVITVRVTWVFNQEKITRQPPKPNND